MAKTRTERITYLEQVANKIRYLIVKTIGEARAGHIGGSLSSADILSALYFDIMNVDPKRPDWADRDRFVLSKGHSSCALYCVLAERGYFPHEHLQTYDHLGSILQGHPDMRKTPGVDMSTGSLGQGLSAGVGMALAARFLGKKFRVFVVLGDGECQEGQIWEAAMCAPHYGLDNLKVIVDYNKLQLADYTQNTMNMEPLRERWMSFGWHVFEINGHNMAEVVDGLEKAIHSRGKPSVIIAHTHKGHGVSFMENNVAWHSRAPNKEEFAVALKEVESKL